MLQLIVDLFSQPVIIIGLIALLGLLVQRSSLGETISGTFKATLGFAIILAASGIIVQALDPITQMMAQGFNLEGYVPTDELVIAGIAAELGSETALIILFGFILNLVFARLTPWKYVYLTGHMLWIHAGAWALVLYSVGVTGALAVAIGSVVQGLYTTLFPAIAQPVVRQVTGGDEIALGHGNTLLAVAGAYIIKPLGGSKQQSAEEIPVPERWNFFRDIAVSTTLIMLAVALGAALYAGPAYVTAELSEGTNYLVFAVVQALTFTAGLLVLLQGVRMFLAEIIPAFQGISERIVPGARPALDIPVFFPYAPNSLIIGLITGSIAQAVAIPIIIALDMPVPIPSMIVAFFASGIGAIFGNAVAGRRGAVFGGFFWAFAGFLLSSWVYQTQLFGDLGALGATGVGFIVPDAIAIAAVIKFIAWLLGLIGIGA